MTSTPNNKCCERCGCDGRECAGMPNWRERFEVCKSVGFCHDHNCPCHTPNKDPMVERIVEEYGQKFPNLRIGKIDNTEDNLKSWLRTTLLRFKEELEGEMIKEVFSLNMYDPMMYGNAKVEVHDLEKWAAKHGYDPEKIRTLLSK